MTDDILNDDGLDLEDDGKKKKRAGRKKEKAPKAEKAPKPKKEKAPESDSPNGEGGGGIVQWLKDTYNGLFKIVIQPQLPSLRVLGFMTIAFFIGMWVAYTPLSISYYDGAPNQMRTEHQDQYVIGVAASYIARIYDDAGVAALLDRVDHPAERVNRLITERTGQTQAALQAIAPIAQTVEGRDAPTGGSFFVQFLQILLWFILFVLVVNIFALLWGLLIGGYVQRFWLTIKKRIYGESEADKNAREAIEAQRKRNEITKQMRIDAETAAASSTLGPALMTKPSIYFKGRAYDDSFAIEDADDMFLGETGATVAKKIGDSGELAAVELWLFDKDDFVKTYTKIFVAEHGFNDPATRSELENRVDDPVNDIVVLRPGAELTVESNNLLMKAKVVDVTPGMDPALPVNSHFDGFTIQMQAWQKKGATVPAGAPGGFPATPPPPAPSSTGLPDLSSYEIGPPPEMPKGFSTPPAPAPSSSGMRDLSEYEMDPPPPGIKPLTPPPMGATPGIGTTRPSPPPPPSLPSFDDDEDDDPFGGTGDFTPAGR